MSENKTHESQLDELRLQTQRLGETYRKLFPKDPAFVYDLILRLEQNPKDKRPSISEALMKEGTNLKI